MHIHVIIQNNREQLLSIYHDIRVKYPLVFGEPITVTHLMILHDWYIYFCCLASHSGVFFLTFRFVCRPSVVYTTFDINSHVICYLYLGLSCLLRINDSYSFSATKVITKMLDLRPFIVCLNQWTIVLQLPYIQLSYIAPRKSKWSIYYAKSQSITNVCYLLNWLKLYVCLHVPFIKFMILDSIILNIIYIIFEYINILYIFRYR